MGATPGTATAYVGIDVAAETLAVAWLVPGRPEAPAETVPNSAAGWLLPTPGSAA